MRVYRLLLRLYPASFRDEYGCEMTAVFAREWRAAGGFPSRLGVLVGAAADLAANAPRVHADLLRQDVRAAVRAFSRVPGVAAMAVLIAGLGIGANAAVFSVADFALLRPLPYPDESRIVRLWESRPGYWMELSPANYRDWRARVTSLDSLAAFQTTSFNLTGQGDPIRVSGAAVEPPLFDALGLAPERGRTLESADAAPGSAAVVVISHALWLSQFGGQADVIGRVVRLDGLPVEVVGVMPAAFAFPSRDAQFWTALQFDDDDFLDRNDNYIHAVGKLRRDRTIDDLRAELGVITADLERRYPVENRQAGAFVRPLRQDLSPQGRMLIAALAGAALCVLLIACANLAGLLLARALGRRRELAVRAALGAGRGRLARQLVTEGVLLAVAGGACAIGIAAVTVPLLSQLVPSTLPTSESPSIDLRVMAVAAMLTAAAGLVMGFFPVLRIRAQRLDDLRAGDRSATSRERVRSVLVVVQIAASVVLLVLSGLLLRALWTVQTIDPGFRPDGVLTLRTALPIPKYEATAVRARFYDDVLTQVRAMPGVTSAAYASFLPMAMRGGIFPVGIDGADVLRREAGSTASLRFVTPDYFRTMGIPLHAGRDVADSDRPDTPFVAVVSASFVRRYWPGEDAIGKRFEFGFAEREIVGIVGDVRVRGLEQDSEPQVYLPVHQVPDGGLRFYAPKDLVVRSSLPPEALAPAVRAAIARVDPQQPVSDIRTLEDLVAAETAPRGSQLRVVGAFGALAVLLGAIGMHGLLSFVVAQRTREIGVRIALGAMRGGIYRLVLGRAMTLGLCGLLPGLLIAYLAGRWLEAGLAGASAADGPVFAAAVIVVIAAVLAGSLMPTRRAVAVDPVQALRSE